MKIRTDEVNPSQFTDDMITYVEDTKQLLELMSEYRKTSRYRIKIFLNQCENQNYLNSYIPAAKHWNTNFF